MKNQLHVTKPEDERKVVNYILQALAKYMLESNIEVKYLSEMKLQKIIFKTVEELELPVTKSWYIRGCMVHPGGTLTGSVKKSTVEKFVNNPKYIEANPDIYACFDNIKINEIFFTERNKFLRNLYRSMKPTRFRNEYIPNNELILSLERLSKGIFDNVCVTISENVSKLYLGMQGDDLFNRVSDNFYRFLDFMENTCIETEGAVEDGAEITQNDLDFFKRLNDTYHNKVWMEPASMISIETVDGISTNRVIEQRMKYLPLAERKIEESLNILEDKSKELNLSLSEKNIEKAYINCYSRIGSDASKKLTEMWKIYAK